MEPKRSMSTNPCFRIAKVLASGEAKDINFVFSPYSFELGLSLLANGSSGSTKEELLSFLEAKNLDDINSFNTRRLDCFIRTTKAEPTPIRPLLEEVLSSSDSDEDIHTKKYGPILSHVGGIWVDQQSPLKPSFKVTAEQIYKVKAETVDFKNKAKEVADRVNAWAEEATNGLIKSVLPEDSLNSMTKLVLANAIYFKAAWRDQFYPLHTTHSKFFLLDGNSVEVPFMSSETSQIITTFDDFKILRLIYEQGWREDMEKEDHMLISMYIILPKQRDGLWNLADKVGSDPEFFDKYITQRAEYVKVENFMIPKFKITFAFEASEILQEVGLKLPFSNDAEFNEMVDGRLEVSDVLHKSYISVNEGGTEAVAVTASDYSFALQEPERQDDFVADHPFMFMVRDDINGVVLFMGHVVNPLLE